MKKLFVLVGILWLAGTAPSGAADDTHENVIREAIKSWRDAAATLATIKDQKTAEAAKPKLKRLGEAMRALRKRQDKLAKATDAERAQLQKKFGTSMRAARTNYLKERARVEKIPGGKDALELLPRPATARPNETKDKKKDK